MKNIIFELNGSNYKLDFHEQEKIWINKNGLFEEIISKSEKLLLNYIDIVRFGIEKDRNISDFNFKFSSIDYKDNKWSNIFDTTFEYSLIFELLENDSNMNYDAYGLYRVHLLNGHITGISREQV